MHSNVIIKSIRCHKCRHVLIPDIKEKYYNSSCGTPNCKSYNLRNFIHLIEENIPPWVKLKVEEGNWTKGKLHCENCGCKVGSFDFVAGRKCECGESILPPIHLISSQVDMPL